MPKKKNNQVQTQQNCTWIEMMTSNWKINGVIIIKN